MQHDARGLPLTAATSEAAACFDATIAAYCGLRKDTGDCLKHTLVADPQFVMAHLLRGYFMMLFGKRENVPRAKAALSDADAAIEALGATDRERLHRAALDAWIAGHLDRAVAHWEAVLLHHPRDLLALKLAQYGTFYQGDSVGMRASTARVLHAWDETVPGFGFVLGCHAFGLEESGDYAAAERAGRRAIEINRADVWAAHAVAHVLEMQNRTREGIAWVGGLDREWDETNNFVFHIRWHRCLFHLEREDYGRVLDLYDREVRAEPTDEYLDITNAVALLWRLEHAGVDVGGRWAELRERARVRLDDHLLVFADVHYAMALATADESGMQTWLKSSTEFARQRGMLEADVMAESGLALGEAALAHRRGDHGRVIELLYPRRDSIRRLGGSHAQRDLYEQMLIDSAIRSRQNPLARALLSERLTLRPDNLWGWRQLAALARATGDRSALAQAEAAAGRILAN
ncbi:MAG TPA: tetratricopeptide repeat protein [Stellaceae bacterium]|nr:tetratricopeptide repeat protein [Stellaceae bacterium]